MNNIKALLVDDDSRYAESFVDKAALRGIDIVYIEDWETAFIELKENFSDYVAVILDGRGKLSPDKPGDDPKHLIQALQDINRLKGENKVVEYYINTAYFDKLIEYFGNEPIFDKKKNQEDLILDNVAIAAENKNIYRIKNKYSDVFECFGQNYLDKNYELLLINIITIFENDELINAENLLFNPCRILLERIFEKITEVDNTVLPYALINFEDQRVSLSNCSKYLNGLPVRIQDQEYRRRKFLKEHISQQIQTIIGICHPASHDIQKYTQYTFKSVLWAIFDVLIWMKAFVDEKS